ncbi:hypothetical protein [Streptomyces sp. NBC_00391]|uniref:hypothetical protein n=1 Tax=Streptomyces sp. NBC_00391 TaxID=2903647 RepID=UPI002E21C43B
MPWSVQTELIRLRFGAAFTQKTLLEKWRHIHEQPSRPWLFDAISQITGGLLTILTLVLGATRLVSGAFGWHPWGLAPWGPHWLAVTVTAVVVTAAVLMYLGVVLFDDHEWLLVTGILAGMVVMICAVYLLWLALVTGRDLMGWSVPLIVTIALVGVFTAASVLTSRINEKRNNPLRAALEAAR